MSATSPGRTRPVTFAGLLLAAAFITAVFSVATVFDSLHRYVELFSHFRLQYLVAALLLFLALLVLRRRLAAVAMLAVIAVNAAYVLPWYSFGRPAQANADVTLTLLLANVRATNQDYGGLLRLIESEQPDIVVVQELTPAWLEALQAKLESWPHRITAIRDDPFGIGLFSRLPITSTERIAGPPRGLPTLVATVAAAGRPITIVATHPMNPISPGGYRARNAQLAHIAGLVASRNADILIGDINTSMWSSTYRELESTTGMHNVRRDFGVLPSWPTFLPIAMIPLDHCLVAPGIEALDVRTGNRIGSDHLPLIVELRLP